MKTLLVTALALLAAFPALAVDAERMKLAEELLTVTRFEDTFRSGWTSNPAAGAPPPQSEAGAMSKQLWLRFKPEYVKAHAEVYTAEEMRGLIAFFKSPLGQVYLNKNPELAAKLMSASDKVMREAAGPK